MYFVSERSEAVVLARSIRPHNADYSIAACQQEFGKKGAVLSRYSCDHRGGHGLTAQVQFMALPKTSNRTLSSASRMFIQRDHTCLSPRLAGSPARFSKDCA